VLAEHVVGASADGAAHTLARASLLDAVAATVAGEATPLAARWRAVQAARRGAATPGPQPDAEWRAFDAAVRAGATQLTDDAPFGLAGAAVWPALLALSDPGQVVGEHHLEAFAVAVAAATALWRCGRYHEAERGFDAGQVFATIAVALAGARLLELDVEQTVAAIAIAASGAGGLIANLGTDAGVLAAATAARVGVRAALLAERGFRGSPIALGGRQGFGEAFFGLSDAPLADLAGELERASAEPTPVRRRRAPIHAVGQRAVAALAGRAVAGEIEELELLGVSPISPLTRFAAPGDAAQAAFSVRFALARVLDGGLPALLSVPFTEVLPAPASLERVRIRIDSRWQAAGPEPRMLRLRAGDTWSEVELSRVDTDVDPQDKWRELADLLNARAPVVAVRLRGVLARAASAGLTAGDLVATA
jgi:2-methylcitrate dehydratase PrpD